MKRCLLFLLALSALVLPTISQAFTVYPINYAGAVSESGTPVNGTRDITLKVYGAPTGGTVLHTQTESLSIVNGIFHTNLVTDPSLWTGADRWVGVSINADPELIPRIQVTWVPYAIRTAYQPMLFTRPPVNRNISGDQWEVVDSLAMTVPINGIATINMMGDTFWSGSASSPAMFIAISETTPTAAHTTVQSPSVGATIYSISPTLMTPVTAGTHVFKVWVKVLVAGQSYAISSRLFQAIFFPVP